MTRDETTPSLESRIARLEHQNRLLLAALLAGLGVLLAGASGTAEPDVVRAGAFEVTDASGRVVAALRLGEAGPELVLVDERDVTRARLSHSADQTALMLQDPAGTTRVGVAQFAHGGGGFALHGEESRGAAVLYLAGGEGSLRFFDTGGGVRLRLPEKASE